MSKVEVDLGQLAAAVSAAILQFAQPDVTTVRKNVGKKDPKFVEKKRGRPKKQKPEPSQHEEKIDEVTLSESNDFTARAKRDDFTIGIGTDPSGKRGKRIPFRKKKRINTFVDDINQHTRDLYNDKGEKIKYPSHTQPREEQVQMEWLCNNCGHKFMAFPSYIPSSIEGVQPMIRCHACNTK